MEIIARMTYDAVGLMYAAPKGLHSFGNGSAIEKGFAGLLDINSIGVV